MATVFLDLGTFPGLRSSLKTSESVLFTGSVTVGFSGGVDSLATPTCGCGLVCSWSESESREVCEMAWNEGSSNV